MRVEVILAGICGTDLHIEQGDYVSEPPVTLGHEVLGRVVETGPGVDLGWLGDRVVTEPYLSTCDTCAWCRDGHPNLCLERRAIGAHHDGGMARYVVVPARGLYRVDSTVPDRAAVLAEPLACVCNALFDPIVAAPGDRVAVIGPGPIGMLAAVTTSLQGAAVTVWGTDSDGERLEIASRLGFEVAYSSAPPEGEREFDAVIECSGHPGGINLALDLIRRRGSLVQMGLGRDPASLNYSRVCHKEIRLCGSFASTPAGWRRAVSLLPLAVGSWSQLVTTILPLDRWEEAFAAVRGQHGLKTALDPQASGPDPGR